MKFIFLFTIYLLIPAQKINDSDGNSSGTIMFRQNTDSERRKRLSVNRVFKAVVKHHLYRLSSTNFYTFLKDNKSSLDTFKKILRLLSRLDYYNIVKKVNLSEKEIYQLTPKVITLRAYCLEASEDIDEPFGDNDKLGWYTECWKMIDGFLEAITISPEFCRQVCEIMVEILQIISKDRPYYIELMTYLNELSDVSYSFKK